VYVCTTKNGLYVYTLDCSLYVRTTQKIILDRTSEGFLVTSLCYCNFSYKFVLLQF